MTETPEGDLEQGKPTDPKRPGGKHDPRTIGSGASADYLDPTGEVTSGPQPRPGAGGEKSSGLNPYAKLGIALGISFILMFVLSMSMIRSLDHFYLNLSNFYMALVMVAPMGLVMVLVMWSMFDNKRLNIALLVGFVAVFGLALGLGRTETFTGNEQFLKSMIPHHSRAILVCQESAITDPQIIELCDEIVKAQRREIDEMKDILDERY